MRNNMDPAEYKHVVLGLIFLKYISDSFEELFNQLKNDPEHLPTPRTKTNTKRKIYFGCRRMRAGSF